MAALTTAMRGEVAATRVAARAAAGFTLIELAIVMAIIGLVLGALLVPLGTQLDASRYEKARAQIRAAEEALLGWAVIKGRLDNGADGLPDPPAGNNGDPGDPLPSCTGSDEGFLPFAALSVPRLDPWGNRLRYRADRAFTQLNGIPDPPDTEMPSSMEIRDRFGAAITLPTPTPSAPAFLVFSCGKNGVADVANNGDGTLAASSNCAAPSAPMDNIYTQDDFAGDAFDDILFFVGRYALIARLAEAGAWPR